IDFAVVIGATARLGAAVEQGIRGHHLRHGHARAQLLAKLAERPVRHTRHRSDEQIVAESEAGKFHQAKRENYGREGPQFYRKALPKKRSTALFLSNRQYA